MKLGGGIVMASFLSSSSWGRLSSSASAFLLPASAPTTIRNGGVARRRLSSAVASVGGRRRRDYFAGAVFSTLRPDPSATMKKSTTTTTIASSSPRSSFRLLSSAIADGASSSATALESDDGGAETAIVELEEEEEEEEEELPTNESDPDLLRIRHTSAHVMAMAVQRTYPEAQVTIGPWIDNGFYYDFYFPETKDAETGEVVPSRKLNEDDLKKIKKAMDGIISKDYPIAREEVSRDEARRRIEAMDEPFKLEILDSIKTEPITIYSIGGEWWDLCAGPHVESTGKLPKKAIQLESVAGAYWRGNEEREMLQRIYATAWKDPNQLKTYKKRMEEARKRDHRVLGKKLDLFSIQVS